MIFIIIAAVAAFLIFAYMRNRQAARNDKRHERLLEKEEQLIQTLTKLRTNPGEQETDN